MKQEDVSIMRRPAAEWRCVYCHDTIAQAPLVCPECRTTTHRECLEELGRCPTMGCQGRRPTPKAAIRKPIRLSLTTPMTVAAVSLALSVAGLLAWFLLGA